MLCLKAHAKINWTLDILGTRSDGYHIMDMLLQSVALHDKIWLSEHTDIVIEPTGSASVNTTGKQADALSAAGVPYDRHNLAYRAAEALQSFLGEHRGVRIQLEKNIPSGAGMGGGSADAAAVLIGLNRLWGLDLPIGALKAIGLSIGADVPFMLTGGLAHVGGVGEEIELLSPAPLVWLVLVQPCDGLSTKEVFAAFDTMDIPDRYKPDTSVAQAALTKEDYLKLAPAMGNVLEAVCFKSRPALRDAAMVLKREGAVAAMMTGSGSVVYGVFENQSSAQKAYDALCACYPFCCITHTQSEGISMTNG